MGAKSQLLQNGGKDTRALKLMLIHCRQAYDICIRHLEAKTFEGVVALALIHISIYPR